MDWCLRVGAAAVPGAERRMEFDHCGRVPGRSCDSGTADCQPEEVSLFSQPGMRFLAFSGEV